MKIAIISKADAYGGGASRVAEDLAILLNKNGHTAHHWLSYHGNAPRPHTRYLYGKFWHIIKNGHRASKLFGFPEIFPFEYFILKMNNVFSYYDIVHFHDLSSAISPYTVLLTSKHIPTVWTFHDCSPFTAGCINPIGCEAYKTRCGDCPQVGKWPINGLFDFTGVLQDIKRKIFVSNLLEVIAPSEWMADMAIESKMFLTRPKVINHSVNTNIFFAKPKKELRKKLRLPCYRNIILISAGNILSEIKGTTFAISALKQVKDLNPFLLVVGEMNKSSHSILKGFDFSLTGYLSDEAEKADYFGAADILLYCSVADNLPLTVLETMAVGIPVVGFATGGVPEMVEHGKSGYLVPQRDIAALVKGIRLAFTGDFIKLWGENAIKNVRKKYMQKPFLDKHIGLYQSVIEKRALNKQV